MKPVLTFDKVCMTYYTKTNQTQALDELSFDINQGEFVSVLGPSGCGKTTLLSLASGTLKPTDGQILLDGKQVTKTSTDVGYMLQRDHLFEWRTIYKNVTLGLEIQKKLTKENLEHCERLIEEYGLKDFKNHYPNELSGGMRQRIALIRAIIKNPDILLLDEPTSSLDEESKNILLDYLEKIKDDKIIIIVSHDLNLISKLDQVIDLKTYKILR